MLQSYSTRKDKDNGSLSACCIFDKCEENDLKNISMGKSVAQLYMYVAT
jgi:hypothetical protein